jgi:hypothetical protein
VQPASPPPPHRPDRRGLEQVLGLVRRAGQVVRDREQLDIAGVDELAEALLVHAPPFSSPL